MIRTTLGSTLALALVAGLALAPAGVAQDRRPPGANPGEGGTERRDHPRWAESIEAGLADAKKRGVALMVALNMDNERGNQGMVDDVYTSEAFHEAAKSCAIAVGSLFKHPTRTDPATGSTVCARFGSVPCTAHQAIESHVRQEWLKRGPKDDVESPRHFFLSPDGKILFQKVWTMTAEDLAALMVRASELCTPERVAAWDTLEARLERAQDKIAAVRDIALAELIAEKDTEIDARLAQLAKSAKDPLVAGSIYGAFASADDGLRRKIAQTALGNGSAEVRMMVAYAMEKSGLAEHLKPLLARAAKEKDAKARGCMYRAIGALGKDDAGARKLLLKAVGNTKDDARGHAALVIGPWAGEKKVQEALEKMLQQGGDGRQRSAAVFALGMSKSDDVKAFLTEFKQGLPRFDWRTRRTCDAAIKNLTGEGTEGYERGAAWILKNPAEGEDVDEFPGGGRGPGGGGR